MRFSKLLSLCLLVISYFGATNIVFAEKVIAVSPRVWVGGFDFDIDDVEQDGLFILGGATLTVRPEIEKPQQYSLTILYGQLDGDAKVSGGGDGDFEATRFDLEALTTWKATNKSPVVWGIGLRIIHLDSKSTLPSTSPVRFPDTNGFKDKQEDFVVAGQGSVLRNWTLGKNHSLTASGSVLLGLDFYKEDIDFDERESGVAGLVAFDASVGYEYKFGERMKNVIGGAAPYGVGVRYRFFGFPPVSDGNSGLIHGLEVFGRVLF